MSINFMAEWTNGKFNNAEWSSLKLIKSLGVIIILLVSESVLLNLIKVDMAKYRFLRKPYLFASKEYMQIYLRLVIP